MCAIVGIINLDKKPVNKKILWEMTDVMAHRGPDGRGIYIDKSLGLGHRRLAIIDLSEAAAQPMQAEGGNYVISYAGEVYNFEDIKKDLRKNRIEFKSHSDAEVVLKSFAKWGCGALNVYNGMFSFAFWDKRKSILTLARDRYGIKPLYYWQNSKVFLFASEIKAFLKHPEFKVDLDHKTLLEYFTFQNTFTHKTLFSGVRLLPPGSYMQVFLNSKKTRIETRQYWDFNFKEDKNVKSENEYLEELDRLFKQAVKRQLVSDVEIGSYLSGGIDSASITAVASQFFKGLKTFSIGFDLSSASGLELSFDERKKAEHISYLYQTEHYEMVLKSGDMKRCLPDLVWALEDLRLGQSYPNFHASKLASRFVKVCLSGGGGDELFAGYPWRYYTALKANNFDEYINGYYKYWQRLMDNSVLRQLFSPIWNKVSDVWTEGIFKGVFGNGSIPQCPEDYINRSLYFEAKTFLHGLFVVEDKLSMAYGLEVRVPFLDNDLVDFACKVPVSLKLNNIKRILRINESELAKELKYFEKTHDGKIILRKVLGKYVDDKITNQHKQGFSGPDASWFRGESIDYVKSMLLDKKASIYNYFDYKTVNQLIGDHISGKQNRRLFIWSLLCFEWWLRLFIAGNGAAKNVKAENNCFVKSI